MGSSGFRRRRATSTHRDQRGLARSAQAFAGVVLVGFVGWLGGMVVRVEGPWVYVLPVVLGAIAALIGRRAIMLPGVWIGILAAYPAGLALGAIAFIGEQWPLYAALFLTSAAAGFGAALVLLRQMQRRSTEMS